MVRIMFCQSAYALDVLSKIGIRKNYLLVYKKEEAKWIEDSVTLDEFKAVFRFLCELAGSNKLCLHTGKNLKISPLGYMTGFNFPVSWRHIDCMNVELLECDPKGSLYVASDGVAFETLVDILPPVRLSSLIELVKELREKLKVQTGKHELKVAGYTQNPIFYRKCKFKLENLRRFITDVRELSREIPLTWLS